MDYLIKTNEYYSKLIGEDNIINNNIEGIRFIYSTERNKVQYGYSKQFDLYIFYQQNKLFVSYGDKIISRINEIKESIELVDNIDDLIKIVHNLFGKNFNHNVKYLFNRNIDILLKSRSLVKGDYNNYLEFFRKTNPNCKKTAWVKEYFYEMVDDHLCCGVYVDDMLVSCTDAPSVPYMQESIQEIGVNTLQDYRRNGYAVDVCISCIKEIVKNKKCPQWSTSSENKASQMLAEKVGLKKYADVLTITL